MQAKELYLNRGVRTLGARRLVTQLRSFSSNHIVQGKGLKTSRVRSVTTSEFSPQLKLPSIICVHQPIDTRLIQSSSMVQTLLMLTSGSDQDQFADLQLKYTV